MSISPTLSLNDQHAIPQVGLGVWRTPNEDAAAAVKAAVEAGYRHVDTAAIYGNEEGVGEGLRIVDVPRKEIFVTTKLWNADQGFDSTLKAFEASAKRLGIDYVDLYLIHWPNPKKDLYVDTWRALIQLQAEGRAKSIGVSNFTSEHIDRLIAETGVSPALNQIELHPRFQQKELREAHAQRGVKTEAWSPLGQGQMLNDPVIAKIAARHGRTPAQTIIRWHIDIGNIVIPKSVTPSRIVENFDVFGFRLDAEDLARIDALDNSSGRIGPNPVSSEF